MSWRRRGRYEDRPSRSSPVNRRFGPILDVSPRSGMRPVSTSAYVRCHGADVAALVTSTRPSCSLLHSRTVRTARDGSPTNRPNAATRSSQRNSTGTSDQPGGAGRAQGAVWAEGARHSILYRSSSTPEAVGAAPGSHDRRWVTWMADNRPVRTLSAFLPETMTRGRRRAAATTDVAAGVPGTAGPDGRIAPRWAGRDAARKHDSEGRGYSGLTRGALRPHVPRALGPASRRVRRHGRRPAAGRLPETGEVPGEDLPPDGRCERGDG